MPGTFGENLRDRNACIVLSEMPSRRVKDAPPFQEPQNEVDARPGETGDQAGCNRVVDGVEEDRDCRGRVLRRERRGVAALVTITSTLRATRSAAKAGSRSM